MNPDNRGFKGFDIFLQERLPVEKIKNSSPSEKNPIIDIPKIFYQTNPFDLTGNLQDSTNFPNLKKIQNLISFEDKYSGVKENNLNKLKKFEIKIENNIEKNKFFKILTNPAFLTPSFLTGLSGISLEPKTGVTIDNIAEFAYPLAQFVHEVRPDYILACDRGARMIAMAVHMLYQRLYGALPTLDHSVHFRKISTKVPESEIEPSLKPLVRRMVEAAQNPTVLVLDDWVSSGGTQRLVDQVFERLSQGRARLLYGVMVGGKADVSGRTDGAKECFWRDKEDIVGIRYPAGQNLSPTRVDSNLALSYRRRMSKSIEMFAKRFAEEETMTVAS